MLANANMLTVISTHEGIIQATAMMTWANYPVCPLFVSINTGAKKMQLTVIYCALISLLYALCQREGTRKAGVVSRYKSPRDAAAFPLVVY